MKWEAPSVVRFATDAGFAAPALHTAVAIALAATNGLDTFDHRAGIPGTGRYVGLWAINIDEWPEYATAELVEPHAAARAAHELTRRCDGFGWSAVWRCGGERHHLALASAASSQLPWTEQEHRPIHTHVVQHKINAMGRRLERKFARGGKL